MNSIRIDKSEISFRNNILPIIKKGKIYSEKVNEIKREIQVYAQIQLIGKYSSKIILGKGRLNELLEDRYYVRLNNNLSKAYKIFQNYQKLLDMVSKMFQNDFGFDTYNKYFKKYVK